MHRRSRPERCDPKSELKGKGLFQRMLIAMLYCPCDHTRKANKNLLTGDKLSHLILCTQGNSEIHHMVNMANSSNRMRFSFKPLIVLKLRTINYPQMNPRKVHISKSVCKEIYFIIIFMFTTCQKELCSFCVCALCFFLLIAVHSPYLIILSRLCPVVIARHRH